jgi:hypothetical protein
MIKKIVSFVLLIVLMTAIFNLKTQNLATETGQLEIVLIGEDENVLDQKVVTFDIGDSLIDILKENFDLQYEEYAFGIFITKIGQLEQNPELSIFISFYINGELSMVGISSIEPIDGMIIEFILFQY